MHIKKTKSARVSNSTVPIPFQVCGHPVPKDTIVLGQIFNVMRNTSVFEQPDEFRPERFLLEDGKTPNKVISTNYHLL